MLLWTSIGFIVAGAVLALQGFNYTMARRYIPTKDPDEPGIGHFEESGRRIKRGADFIGPPALKLGLVVLGVGLVLLVIWAIGLLI